MDKQKIIKEKFEKLSVEDKKKIKSMAEKGVDCFPQLAAELKISQQSLNKYLKLL